MPDLLRPKPFRGDQVAAGAVFLALFVLLVEVRFAGSWSDGAMLFVSGAAALFVLAMAVPVPIDGAGPRAYLGSLYICAWVLSAFALVNLADVLGGRLFASGTVTWVGGALTALGLFFSRRRDAASGTLLAGLAGSLTFVAFIDWTVGIDSAAGLRQALLAVVAVLGIAALWQRVRGPAHGVQLLNVVGLAVLVIAITFLIELAFGLLFGANGSALRNTFGSSDELSPHHPGTGWAALVLLTGLSLVAAGAADGERGNVVVGVIDLLAFALLASTGNLVGWPILLAIAAGVLLVIGLRPSTPLPPEPDPPDGGGPLVELRPI